jgi:hypothetical protein
MFSTRLRLSGMLALAHPTIRAGDRPYPRSLIAGTVAFACRDPAELRGNAKYRREELFGGALHE